MKKLLALLLTLFVAYANTLHASNVDQLISTFKSGSASDKKQVAQKLQYAGVTDVRLYDLIEAELKAGHEGAVSKAAVDDMAWLTKGLAYSGNEKYRSTIEEVAEKGGHRKLRKYAKKSLDILDTYSRWQPILADKSKYKKGKSDDINRYASMLDSDELGLQVLAAKRIYNAGIQDQYLLDILKQATEKNLSEGGGSKEYVQATAYMLKALIASREQKYVAVVEDAASNASNKKVRKYAKKYLKQYR